MTRHHEKGKTAGKKTAKKFGRGTGVPHPVDVEVGERIRTRRLLLGMNQETLAGRLGLTFQQVQKYEHGANRVSASRLAKIAEALDVPIMYFFDRITEDTNDLNPEQQRHRDLMRLPETIDLVRLFYAIPDEPVRRQFLDLVKAVASQAQHKEKPAAPDQAAQPPP